MMIRCSFVALALAGLTTPAMAGEDVGTPSTVQLTAEQIETLLAGNTIDGSWSGSGYTQYYGEGTFTVYIPDGGEPDEGKWRIDAEADMYESWWRSTGWTPYALVATNDGYAWVNGESLEPFEVIAGKQVSW